MYQGERTLTKDCRELGRFDLSGIPPAPKGVPQIEVSFDVDANGILQVKAEDKGAKNSNSITLTSNNGGLSEEEIERMIKEAEEFAEEDNMLRERIETRNKLENYIYNMKNSISNNEQLANEIDYEDKERIESTLEQVSEWLNDNPNAEKDDLDDKYHEVEAVCNPIISKIYNQRNNQDESEDSHDEL